MRHTLKQIIPMLSWAKSYSKVTFTKDLVASIIITMMFIPQALAYALLAGLPPQLGLYASILPLLAYAVFGTSGALSVGPFAIASIMTATALNAAFSGELSSQVSLPTDYIAGAVVLAFLSGLFLLLFGFLRLGFLSNFLSFPVVSGFISASALVIGSSQLGNLLGISASGDTLLEVFSAVIAEIDHIKTDTLLLGAGAFILLFFGPKIIKSIAITFHANKLMAELLSKTVPILVMLISVACVIGFDLEAKGVDVIGDIPALLPVLSIPNVTTYSWSYEVWESLISSAVLISIIGFVSSLSIAQTFAAKKRQRINPNQEALALGFANLGSGLSGGFPVSASLSRSAVSFNAGAETPATGAFTAIALGFATLYLTPYLHDLPIATLAAMILVAVISLVDLKAIKRSWQYSRQDFSALLLTVVLTLVQGVEAGLISGVLLSIALHLYRSSNPHVAELGRVPDTEHFRNIERHNVITQPNLIFFRVDESLYFANARFLEDKINELVAEHPEANHFVMVCSSINDIDASALESLFSINHYLQEAGMKSHLSEVKGPVLDRLKRSDFLDQLTGNVYLSNYDAWSDLSAS